MVKNLILSEDEYLKLSGMGNRRSIGFRIVNKIRYRYSGWALNTSTARLPETYKTKRNVLIYFDYEREFGGFESNITDDFIDELLSVLDSYKIRATWFTVGKIFELYPETISSILDRGHEIASHSYRHSVIQKMSGDEIRRDFEMFSTSLSANIDVIGFHSPQGRWNTRMFNILSNAGYAYDVALDKASGPGRPVFVKTKAGRILRINTVGDDWPLYAGRYSEQEMHDYFISLSDRIRDGDVAGIGFHPWILYSKPAIYKGFRNLLESLSTQEDIIVKRAVDYYREISDNNK